MRGNTANPAIDTACRDGGGIYNEGVLVLERSTVHNNNASHSGLFSDGGGIYNT